ncbi:hypothetical protein NMG60_11028625 [Bertholletia excelsa]
MGNYISCALAAPGDKQSRAMRVILPTGEVQQLDQPAKAAELMLENPSFFVVNTRSLHVGRRFSALNADEDLEMGNVYVMFPMRRVNSVVTAADVGPLFLEAQKSAGNTVRVLPEPAPEPPSLDLEDIETEIKHRLSMCRSKKPVLETIAEEPVCSR